MKRPRPVDVRAMRALDRRVVRDFGLPTAVLMENAGRAVAAEALRMTRGPVAVLCGTGNNGGDGLVAARWLFLAGRTVRLVLARPPARFGPDARVFWPSLRRLKIPWRVFDGAQKLVKFTTGCRLWIDALVGVGARGPLRAPMADLVRAVNADGRPVLAVDVPSGLDADTGRAAGDAMRATRTLALGRIKIGLTRAVARPRVGRLLWDPIGFPPDRWLTPRRRI
ncbi:MAG TPA: NAD(P)H-hydrate epimerase [Elusimicrobiota bacterium]|nr:NAD(P)H-hydrate epimerase [Elusimicrobiota bacterium]